MIDILLCSTQPVLAAGLAATMAGSENYRIVRVCSTIPALAAGLSQSGPAIALLDNAPALSLDEIAQLRAECPAALLILWTERVSTEFASQLLALGVRGVLRKTLPIGDLLRCLQVVADGQLWIEKSLSDALLSTRRISLTGRERQLMGLLAQGLKNKEVAYTLGITEGTVKVYFSRLFQKVGAGDRLDLALFALRQLSADGTVESAVRCSAGTASPRALYLPSFVSRRPLAGAA